MSINKNLRNIIPYKVSSQKVYSLGNLDAVLKLDWNESTIQPSPKVSLAIEEYLNNQNLNWYPNVKNDDLLDLLSKYCDLDKDNIQYFASSDNLHEYIARTFLNNGEKVAIIAPTYDNFRIGVESLGAKIVYFYLDHNFQFDIIKFKKFLDLEKPRMVYICNPNNPTGTSYLKSDLELLFKSYLEIYFIIDEAYFEFLGTSCAELVSKYDNLIITRTFSKAFGLASFRIGYMLSSKKNIDTINLIRNPKSVTSISQIAAIAALKDLDYMKKYVNEVICSREHFVSNLESLNLEVYADKGNFILVNLLDMKSKCINYLEKNNIFIRDLGHIKMLYSFVRITIGTEEQMNFVFEKIRECLE